MLREYNHFADFPLDAIFVIFLGEIAPQPFFRHIRADRVRVASLARDRQSFGVQISGENLDFRPGAEFRRLILKQDGE